MSNLRPATPTELGRPKTTGAPGGGARCSTVTGSGNTFNSKGLNHTGPWQKWHVEKVQGDEDPMRPTKKLLKGLEKHGALGSVFPSGFCRGFGAQRDAKSDGKTKKHGVLESSGIHPKDPMCLILILTQPRVHLVFVPVLCLVFERVT